MQAGITDYTYTQLVVGDLKVGDSLVADEGMTGGIGSRSSVAPKFGGPRP
jgi:hypothetical protein